MTDTDTDEIVVEMIASPLHAAAADGAPPLPRVDACNAVALARAGHWDAVDSALTTDPTLLRRARDPDGTNLLFVAAAAADADRVLAFVGHAECPDIDSQDRSGHTALRFAAAGGHARVVACLLKAGASPRLKDTSGHDAIWVANDRHHPHVVALLNEAATGTTRPSLMYIICLTVICCTCIAAVVTITFLSAEAALASRGRCDNSSPGRSAGRLLQEIELRLNVTLLTSDVAPYLDAQVSAAHVLHWIEIANDKVWEPHANIRLIPHSVQRWTVNDTLARAFRNRRVAEGDAWDVSGVGTFEQLRPLAVKDGDDPGHFHLFVVHDIPICGSALTGSSRGRGSFFVRETPCKNHEELSDSLDVQGVVVAHELGHVLGLPHHPGDCNVMNLEEFGFALTQMQVETARSVAATGRGFSKV